MPLRERRALVRWSAFALVTGRKPRLDLSMANYFAIADREDLSYGEKLAAYRKLADEYFETDRYLDFCESRMNHVGEVVLEWVESPDFDALLVETVRSTYPPEEHDRFVAHFRGLVGLWVRDRRPRRSPRSAFCRYRALMVVATALSIRNWRSHGGFRAAPERAAAAYPRCSGHRRRHPGRRPRGRLGLGGRVSPVWPRTGGAAVAVHRLRGAPSEADGGAHPGVEHGAGDVRPGGLDRGGPAAGRP